MLGVGLGEDGGSGGLDLGRPSGVDGRRGQEPDAAVAVLGVVPSEERPGEGAGGLDRSEASREAGPVLEGLEVGLRIRGCR